MNQDIEVFEERISLFVQDNDLRPGDAIEVKKMPFKLLRHYIIYLGTYLERHVFMANTQSGIKVFNYVQLMEALDTFIPEKIERFIGTYEQRREAVQRALQRKDENSYMLLLNNCEHFKNWVQNGQDTSKQVKKLGQGAVATGAAIALATSNSKSNTGLYTGLGMMLLGGILWALNDEDEETQPEVQTKRIR